MPINKYFKNSGEKVMKNLKDEYGNDKGENVFYALANKQKAAEENARSYAEERNRSKKSRG